MIDANLVVLSAAPAERLRWLSPGRLAAGKVTILDGDPGLGKALALDTPIPTPTGWTTMAEVRVGDDVFGGDGVPCQVIAVSDVMVDRPCYRLILSDGSTVVADAEHLWATTDRTTRHREARRRWKRAQVTTDRRNRQPRPDRLDDGPRIRSTADIAATLRLDDGRTNHAIEVKKGARPAQR